MALEISKAPKGGITYGGESLQEYKPPVLFPDIGKYVDSEQQREYVMQMIERMHDDDQLCITDMLAQPSRIRNLCGRIIFGINVNPDSMREERAQRDLKAAVMAHPFKIVCIEGRAESVVFKRGVVSDPRTAGMVYTSSGGKEMGVGSMDEGAGVSWSRRMVSKVDEIIDYKSPEAVLDLKDAWICLSKYGEYCVRAKNKRMRNTRWRYREVLEDGTRAIDRNKPRPEPEKRGPGRPRKT